MPVELTVVIPTFNERQNVRPIVNALDDALKGIDWEAVFVDDDSPDGTAQEARDLAATHSRVRVIQRIGRRGLASACIEGMMSSTAPHLAVIDADMQHDEKVLPAMLEVLKREGKDLVIGSRYMEGGGTGNWQESRRRISRLAGRLSHLALRTDLSDPMSGFFMLKADLLHRVVRKLSGKGFKILLDIVLSAGRDLNYGEVPYTMRARQRGDSKLDILVVGEYVQLLLDKSIGRLLPVRFLMFVGVGLLGAMLHVAVLGGMLFLAAAPFYLSQGAATFVAMTSNYLLNNLFTYRHHRQRGWRLARGLLLFYLLCSIGWFINVQVADALYHLGLLWWGAGILGAMVSAVWNYSMTSAAIWTRRR